jgi:hypothetical protein
MAEDVADAVGASGQRLLHLVAVAAVATADGGEIYKDAALSANVKYNLEIGSVTHRFRKDVNRF